MRWSLEIQSQFSSVSGLTSICRVPYPDAGIVLSDAGWYCWWWCRMTMILYRWCTDCRTSHVERWFCGALGGLTSAEWIPSPKSRMRWNPGSPQCSKCTGVLHCYSSFGTTAQQVKPHITRDLAQHPAVQNVAKYKQMGLFSCSWKQGIPQWDCMLLNTRVALLSINPTLTIASLIQYSLESIRWQNWVDSQDVALTRHLKVLVVLFLWMLLWRWLAPILCTDLDCQTAGSLR